MRVLYLIPQRAVADPNTASVADALAAAGHDVAIVPARGRTRIGGILGLVRRAPRIARRSRPDAILCRDLDTLWAGATAKAVTGAKLVYWAHDVYSHMVEADVPRFVYLQTVHHERKLLPYADAIIASNQGVVDWLGKEQAPKDGIGLDDPITIVMPCRVPQVYFPPPGQRRLGYFGTLHKNRFVREMVEAMPAIREGFGDPRPSLTIAGPRDRHGLYDWLKKNYDHPPEAFEDDVPPVIFLGTLPPEDVLLQTYESDVIVSMLDPADKCLRVGLANKVFDAMSVGRAAVGTRGTATGDLIAETGMGLTPPYGIDTYVAAVRHMLRDDTTVQMGLHAYYAGKTKYNWHDEAKKLVAVFEEL